VRPSSISHPLVSTLQSKMQVRNSRPRSSSRAMHLQSLVHSSPLGQQLLDHVQVSILGGYVQRCCTALHRHKKWSAEVSEAQGLKAARHRGNSAGPTQCCCISWGRMFHGSVHMQQV